MFEAPVKYTHPCGWYRIVVNGGVYDHPLWGRVSHYEAARLDVAHHNCVLYREALRKVHLVVKEWNDAHDIKRHPSYLGLRRAVD